MHPSFDLFLVISLFLLLQLFLKRKHFLFSVVSRFSEQVAPLSCEPSSDAALNVKSRFISLLQPHYAAEILGWINYLIVSSVNVQTRFLHLSTLFAHHVGGLCLVLVSLNLTFFLIRMVVDDLIRLGEGMVVSDS